MATRIRLARAGRKKKPFYRIVVTDSRAPRDSGYKEVIGTYNPLTEPSTFEVNKERALYWLSQGAKPSEAVERIFEKVGLLAEKANKS